MAPPGSITCARRSGGSIQTILDVPPVFGKSLASTPKTGAELKGWREAHGWSLGELATRAGVGKTTLYRAEHEPRKPLSMRLVNPGWQAEGIQ